jgi:hypothetical protein
MARVLPNARKRTTGYRRPWSGHRRVWLPHASKTYSRPSPIQHADHQHRRVHFSDHSIAAPLKRGNENTGNYELGISATRRTAPCSLCGERARRHSANKVAGRECIHNCVIDASGPPCPTFVWVRVTALIRIIGHNIPRMLCFDL